MSNRKEHISTRFVSFWGGIYSNWYKKPFNYRSVQFSSMEQYLMYCKALLFRDKVTASKIMAIHNVSKIKELGREVNPFNERVWKRERVGIAVRGIYAKFSQDSDLKTQMLADFNRGQRSFIEASPKDGEWGILLGQNDPRVQDFRQWRGTNFLGLCLDLVATRLLIENGDTLVKLPLNVAMLIEHFSLLDSTNTEKGIIDAIGHTILNHGYTSFMDFDDYMHGGQTYYDSLRHFLGFENKSNQDYVDFYRYSPNAHNPEWYLAFPSDD